MANKRKASQAGSGLKEADTVKINQVVKRASEGANRYAVGEVERYDQKNEMFKRPRWDPSVEYCAKFYGVFMPREDKPGYTLLDLAFKNAAWWLELGFAKGVLGGKEGLFAWDAKQWGETKPPTGLKLKVDDPVKMAKVVKKVARYFGASLVGICELDRRWVYSYSYHMQTKEHAPVEIPEECKYAIATAVEMDYEAMRTSPALTQGAATGLGYSEEAFTAGLLAQFIRALGYQGIPQGNDTSCSIPVAIDAGLGELSRSGQLITPEFGPRVRVSKVFTDMPLVSDNPIEFGVWEFCRKCEKCAIHCPSQAIIYGEPTEEIHNISNRKGLLRWPINAEKCFAFWAAQGGSCANCIRVCPFNKPPGRLHSWVRWGVQHTRWLDSLFVRADDLLGYGKQISNDEFWRK
jgi:epoxyqueuosine reductase